MKTTWQSLPKQPRAALHNQKTMQEKGEMTGALPGARFTNRSFSEGGLIIIKKPTSKK